MSGGVAGRCARSKPAIAGAIASHLQERSVANCSEFKIAKADLDKGRHCQLRPDTGGPTLTNETSTTVIARLDWATEYSRDASDRIEKPRCTGSPGQAGRRRSCCGAPRSKSMERTSETGLRPDATSQSRGAMRPGFVNSFAQGGVPWPASGGASRECLSIKITP
jgi:hypothetical protein